MQVHHGKIQISKKKTKKQNPKPRKFATRGIPSVYIHADLIFKLKLWNTFLSLYKLRFYFVT